MLDWNQRVNIAVHRWWHPLSFSHPKQEEAVGKAK